MNICLDLVCDEAQLLSAAGKYFASNGHTVSAMTMGKRWPDARLTNFQCISLTDTFSHSNYRIGEELARIEKTYGEYIPASFIAADRFLCTRSRDYSTKVLVHTFHVLENAFLANQVDIVLSTGVAYLYNLVALSICKKHGIPHVSFYHTRQDKAAFTFSTNKGGNWDEVADNYVQLGNDEKPTEEELKYAVSRIASFREQFNKPAYMNTARQSHSIQAVFIKEFFQRLRRWYVDKWGQEADDYITMHPLWYAIRDVKKLLRIKFFNVLSKDLFDSVIHNDKFFLYPLHLQPEASTLVLSPHYTNQLEVIRSIAKELPADHLLYVKEHPSAYGRHSLAFYKAIKSIYNVRLISAQENTKGLLKNTAGIIVLSGTMGWEGFLLQKPVFVMGSVFYDVFDGIKSAKGFTDLGSGMRNIDDFVVASEDQISNALIAIYRAQYDGLFDVHKMDTAKTVLGEKNIQQFIDGADSIIQYLTHKNGKAIQ